MILLPKFKDIRIPQGLTFHTGLAGEFRCILRDLMGRSVHETPWDSNLILNNGLNIIADTPTFSKCSIGDDDTTPIGIQTMLGNRLQTSNNSPDQNENDEWHGSPTYAHSRTVRLRFDPGVDMDVKEMGMHPSVQPDDMYCRHVLAAPFNKTVDNILDIYYKHSVIPPLGDVTYSDVTILGEDYDIIIRPADLNHTLYNTAFNIMQEISPASHEKHYDGDIGSITTLPAGTSTGNWGLPTMQDYIANSIRHCDFLIRLGDGNLSTGKFLRCFTFPWNGATIQVQFDATTGDDIGKGLPKDDTKQIEIVLAESWGIGTPP